VRTAIWKESVGARPVLISGVNLDGDDQADRVQHGGPDKAVYAYAEEDYQFWAGEAHILTSPGLFGENLTLRGVDLRDAVVGERWRVGAALLEVAQPRLPCFKLGMRMADPLFPRRFQAAGRAGAYLRIVEAGHVRAADALDVVRRPQHGVTLRQMLDSLGDPGRSAALLAAPELPDAWRRRASGHDPDQA
jgi:MOSC domain-containing protein YiiM